MTNNPIVTETLSAVAAKIAQYATEADERTVEAAKLVREARQRVEAGESGETTWYSWAIENIKLSPSRLRELQRIAEAKDPQKAIEHLRQKTRERVARHRQTKAAPLRNGGAVATETVEIEAERERLITWAQKAPLDQVAEVLSYIEQFEGVVDTDSDAPLAPAAAA